MQNPVLMKWREQASLVSHKQVCVCRFSHQSSINLSNKPVRSTKSTETALIIFNPHRLSTISSRVQNVNLFSLCRHAFQQMADGITHTKLIWTPSLWAFGPRRSENREDVGVKRKLDKSWHAKAPFIWKHVMWDQCWGCALMMRWEREKTHFIYICTNILCALFTVLITRLLDTRRWTTASSLGKRRRWHREDAAINTTGQAMLWRNGRAIFRRREM